MKRRAGIVMGIAAGLMMVGQMRLSAEGENPAEALAKESEAACTASAKDKPTPQMLIDKVNEACALVEKDGKASFAKFQGKDSKFIFAGTYVWIHSFEGTMLMHPIKYKLNDKPVLSFQDSKGKKFFVEMIELCKDKGAGWVDYMWPKPGEKESVLKVSYIKKAKCDGKDVVVGCGVYDMTLADVQKSGAK
jgi:cytochrome c